MNVLLKAGAGIDDRTKPFNWMDQKTWLNLKALSKHRFGKDPTFFFKELPDRIIRNESTWRRWMDENEPENVPVPDYVDKFSSDQNQVGHFIHLCLIRALREDRAMLASTKFIAEVLGEEYVHPVTDTIDELWQESKVNIPVLYLLSAGADPTATIDEYAKKKKKFPTEKVSMGEEQEKIAMEKIKFGFMNGDWIVLQNCHLGLEFMAEMEEVLNPKGIEVNEEFRVWITCEPHPEFPLGLLQMGIKVTNEPPKGLQAGLHRTFTTVVSPDFLEKVEPYDKWRSLLFTTCFLHSIV